MGPSSPDAPSVLDALRAAAVDSVAEMDDPSGEKIIRRMRVRRVKESYRGRGYDIEFLGTESDGIFVAFPQVNTLVYVIGVVVSQHLSTIARVRELVGVLRAHRLEAEGCIVLAAPELAMRQRQRRAARDAGLFSQTLGDLADEPQTELERLVRLKLASWIATPVSPAQAEEREVAHLESEVRSFLRSPAQVLVVQQMAGDDTALCEQLARSCASGFLLPNGSPAPLLLRVAGDIPSCWDELARTALPWDALRYDPASLRSLLDEGMLLPLFQFEDWTGLSEAYVPLVREALGERARALLFVRSNDPVKDAEIEVSLQLPISAVRVVPVAAAASRLTSRQHAPLAIFIACAVEDRHWRKQLEKHLATLRHQRLVQVFHEEHIQAGEPREQQLAVMLDRADAVVTLVSSDFLDSAFYAGDAFNRILSRRDRGDLRLIPVWLRTCVLEGTAFHSMALLPSDGKPVAKWPDADEAWAEVVRILRNFAVNRRASGWSSTA